MNRKKGKTLQNKKQKKENLQDKKQKGVAVEQITEKMEN